ncbi:SnoaL-like domain-containing protein [Nonomuraea sp. FMUSA5-5]|uniref:SnoaL-like domain-containing protein n=1 Tax=Nonomuraea composti TaxID=2720023 RepID=A0ABX1BL41_9ACTN|nr:nuclear transport factor 2 family protein [Nonomuraea sp. FMUSA5-5]NJP97115.1 SnoaL-like domain-containing protein [Nonomuraea sp. FMUSA5-5]
MNDLDIADRFEIQQAIGRYSHAFDSGDVEGWIGLLADDGIFEVVLVDQPDWRGLFQGSAELRQLAESSMARVGHVLHVDHWRRTEGGWRIQHRLYLALGYAGTRQPSGPSAP